MARWAPLSGIAFVVLWMAVFAVTLSGDEGSKSDAEILADYADAATRNRADVGFFLTVLAGLFFLCFLVLLRNWLARAEGSAGPYTALAFGAGLVASAIWLVAGVLFMTVAYTIDETDGFVLDPNTERLVNETAYVVFVVGTPVAALTVLATSLLGLKAGAVPRWLAWLGFPIAAVMILAFLAVVPFLLFLAWVFAVSAEMIWRPAGAAGGAAEA